MRDAPVPARDRVGRMTFLGTSTVDIVVIANGSVTDLERAMHQMLRFAGMLASSGVRPCLATFCSGPSVYLASA